MQGQAHNKRQNHHQQQPIVSQEDEIKKLKDTHLKEMYRVYYKLNKLIQKHDNQMKESQRKYQNMIEEKDNKIKSLQQLNLKQKNQLYPSSLKELNLEQNVAKLKKENQELNRTLRIYQQLEDILIEKEELRPMNIYSKCSKAAQKGLLSNHQDIQVNEDGWCLIIPEQVLNGENIKILHDLLIKNQWKGLQYLCFLSKTQFQIKQKSDINDELWKAIVQKGESKRFSDLKILDLKNHKILSITKGELEQFESLKKLDFSTIQIDKNNENNMRKYKQSLNVLREYANNHPNIKIQANLQNGQWVQWYQKNTTYSNVQGN